MKICAVAWCAAFATKGDHCPVHAINPDLHPDYLGPDEEFCADMQPCDECDGSGDCDTCDGSGECSRGSYRDCTACGASTAHECGHCEGTGQCGACNGEGRVTFKKREAS